MPPNLKSRLKRPERIRSAMALAIEMRTYSGLSLVGDVCHRRQRKLANDHDVSSQLGSGKLHGSATTAGSDEKWWSAARRPRPPPVRLHDGPPPSPRRRAARARRRAPRPPPSGRQPRAMASCSRRRQRSPDSIATRAGRQLVEVPGQHHTLDQVTLGGEIDPGQPCRRLQQRRPVGVRGNAPFAQPGLRPVPAGSQRIGVSLLWSVRHRGLQGHAEGRRETVGDARSERRGVVADTGLDGDGRDPLAHRGSGPVGQFRSGYLQHLEA